MVAQRSLVLLAAIFAAARSQAPVGGGPHGQTHVARYLRGEGRGEEEAAPALHYFATDPEWKYVAVRRTASEPVELFDVASESDEPVARFAFKGEPPEIYAGATEYIISAEPPSRLPASRAGGGVKCGRDAGARGQDLNVLRPFAPASHD